jgi:hypothetical protein
MNLNRTFFMFTIAIAFCAPLAAGETGTAREARPDAQVLAYPREWGLNLLDPGRGGAVTAVSSDATGRGPGALNDGRADEMHLWQPDWGREDYFADVRLAGKSPVTRICITTRPGAAGRPKEIEIAVLDGAPVSGTAAPIKVAVSLTLPDKAVQEATFEPIDARQLRILFKTSYAGRELEVGEIALFAPPSLFPGTADSDIAETDSGDRWVGRVVSTALKVKTDWGEVSVPADGLASAFFGKNAAGGAAGPGTAVRLVLKSGEVVCGRAMDEKISFSTVEDPASAAAKAASGKMEIRTDRLARIGFKMSEADIDKLAKMEDDLPPSSSADAIYLADGSRLLGEVLDREWASCAGDQVVSVKASELSEISMRMRTPDAIFPLLILTDGTVLISNGIDIKWKGAWAGERTIKNEKLVRVVMRRPEAPVPPPERAALMLRTGDVLLGEFKENSLIIDTEYAGAVTVPLKSIRSMEYWVIGTPSMPFDAVRVRLDNGGTFKGILRNNTLKFQLSTAEAPVVSVHSALLMSYIAVGPEPSLDSLAANLASDDAEVRAAAAKGILKRGHDALFYLNRLRPHPDQTTLIRELKSVKSKLLALPEDAAPAREVKSD